MQTWVVTDPKAEVIYGTVEAGNEVEAAASADGGQARWFSEPNPPEQLAPHAALTLADGRWRELAPAGPGSHGDCGGDVQVTDSYSRRFAMIRPDGLWAVITYVWYGINESVKPVTEGTMAEVVEQQIQFQIVDDPHDLDVEVWWDDDYSKQYDPEPTEDGVRVWAEDFTAAEISWNGKTGRGR